MPLSVLSVCPAAKPTQRFGDEMHCSPQLGVFCSASGVLDGIGMEWRSGTGASPSLVGSQRKDKTSAVQVAPFGEATACRECLRMFLLSGMLSCQELCQERADGATFDWIAVLGERHTLLLAMGHTSPHRNLYSVCAQRIIGMSPPGV